MTDSNVLRLDAEVFHRQVAKEVDVIMRILNRRHVSLEVGAFACATILGAAVREHERWDIDRVLRVYFDLAKHVAEGGTKPGQR